MVAKTAPLPNIRKLLQPDPGYILCDCDLAQADAQVVAWEADDAELKAIFRDPKADLHDENSKTIYGKLTKEFRQKSKAGVHLTNYGGKAPTCARALGITIHEAERFQRRWFEAHPGILDWHRRVLNQLESSRCIYNKFGNRRYYFDRIDGILPQALAWIPQSTVALVIDRGMVNLDEQLPVELLLQVHDSCVFQFKEQEFPHILLKVKKCLEIEVPYDDPLIIPTSADISRVSWGDVKAVNWDGSSKAA